MYFVTVIGFDKKQHSRCWGYYPEKEVAIRSVKENWMDMFEMEYYTHAVVEAIPAGICAFPEEIGWFHATYPNGHQEDPVVVEVERPAFAEGICSWSLG